MQELLEKIKKAQVEFTDDAAKAVAGNKAAGVRSRAASSRIDKLMKEWRKVSVPKA